MDSYGELLRQTREEKGLIFDNIAREIAIDKKYLQGLEDEDASVFPGEPYFVGYLKNYAEYLGIDSSIPMRLYNNKKIQESPVPEGLIPTHKDFPWELIIILSAILILVGTGITLWFTVFKKAKPVDETLVVDGTKQYRKYELDNTKFTNRLYKGDQLIVPSENGKIILTVKSTLKDFALDTPAGVFYTELSEEAEYDINGDGASDMILYVSDISATDERRGAEISVILRHGVPTLSEVNIAEIPMNDAETTKHTQTVILEDNRAYPFTLNASFRGACLFRDRVDRNDSVETYFSNGEIFTATAQNGIRIWMSNSNAVKFTVVAGSVSKDLPIGKSGEVGVQDIKWVRDTDGKYKLVVVDLD